MTDQLDNPLSADHVQPEQGHTMYVNQGRTKTTIPGVWSILGTKVRIYYRNGHLNKYEKPISVSVQVDVTSTAEVIVSLAGQAHRF